MWHHLIVEDAVPGKNASKVISEKTEVEIYL
jgi:hypothetical protein